jgi:hypothetical protein
MKNPFSNHPPKSKFDLYIAFDHRHPRVMYRNGESLPYDPPIDHPRHWMLVLTPQDQIDSCTFYHVRRSATGYDKCVEGGQSLLLSRVDEYTKLATLK